MASPETPRAGREQVLRKVPSALNVPPMLLQPGVENLDSPATIPSDTDFPVPHWTKYRLDAQKRRMPQCIAHRGYKAKFPENTMVSFKGAVAAGTHALETDVHVTKDEVVVLSHDPGLKRCFGVDRKIKDCSWEEVRECRTVGNGDGKGKGEPMPRLKDILEYLAQPGLEDIWLMLDIKLSNDAPTIMRLLGETISSTPSSSSTLDSDGGRKAKPWSERIVLGIWAAKYLPLALNHLPSFSVIHIGFSLSYSRHFFSVPNVSFNMLLAMLMAPGGKKFLRDAREVHHRLVYAWTVNEKDKMEWCIRRKLDGVVTDDVGKFLEVCERFDESRRVRLEISLRGYFDMVMIYAWVSVAAFLFRNWLKPVASQALIRKRSVDGGKKGGS